MRVIFLENCQIFFENCQIIPSDVGGNCPPPSKIWNDVPDMRPGGPEEHLSNLQICARGVPRNIWVTCIYDIRQFVFEYIFILLTESYH